MELNTKSEFPIKFEEFSKPITMQFTRNKELIAEYKELREKLYKSDPRFVGFRIFNEAEAENYEEDVNDQMLIIHDGQRCLGGACLRVSTPKNPVVLYLEQEIIPPPGKPYFSFREHLPDMQLDKYSYTEFVRIAIEPSLRNGTIIRKMFQVILDRCIKYRIRYVFGFGDAVRTRFYRQVYINAGVEGGIRKDIDVPMRPEYEDVRMYLIAGDMRRFHVTKEDPEAKLLLDPREDFEFTS